MTAYTLGIQVDDRNSELIVEALVEAGARSTVAHVDATEGTSLACVLDDGDPQFAAAHAVEVIEAVLPDATVTAVVQWPPDGTEA